ncbi:MAG TPA: hypothetical protein VKI64_05890 [Acidimicrobiales bacterium]|nr:hypothetical protein [Acidimicrobiales bacterium]
MRRGRLAALPLATLAMLLLGACRVTVGVGVESRADGTGRVLATVTLDRDAADQVPDLASQLRVADLGRAGWTITGPLRKGDGSAVVRASKPFRSPAQVPAIVAELGGPNGPLRAFRLVQHRGLFTSRVRFSGSIDLRSGVESFGDPQLRQRLGGSSLGVDPKELQSELGVSLDRVVDVRVSLRLGGSVSSNSSGGGATWHVPLGSTVLMRASAHQYDWRRIEIVAGAAAVALLTLLMVLRRRAVARRGGGSRIR